MEPVVLQRQSGKRPQGKGNLSHLQDVSVPLERVHQSSIVGSDTRRAAVLCHLVIYAGKLRQTDRREILKHNGNRYTVNATGEDPYGISHGQNLTLARSCSISTDMASNILSWVELLRSGVVSELKVERKIMNHQITSKNSDTIILRLNILIA